MTNPYYHTPPDILSIIVHDAIQVGQDKDGHPIWHSSTISDDQGYSIQITREPNGADPVIIYMYGPDGVPAKRIYGHDDLYDRIVSDVQSHGALKYVTFNNYEKWTEGFQHVVTTDENGNKKLNFDFETQYNVRPGTLRYVYEHEGDYQPQGNYHPYEPKGEYARPAPQKSTRDRPR